MLVFRKVLRTSLMFILIYFNLLIVNGYFPTLCMKRLNNILLMQLLFHLFAKMSVAFCMQEKE